MKVLEIHIDNFGTLSNYNVNFNDGLNTILEENGWGKTTLTVFIKAMLYGLDTTSSKDVDKNNRLKFYPWNDGPFGGTLTFEAKGKKYRIERSFSKKAAEDECKVYDLQTNKETKEFGESIGITLFGIDAGAFEKSMFIPQKDFDFEFGDSLKSKLANIFGNLDDTQDVKAAVKAIEEADKDIVKKTGGKISELKQSLDVVDKNILNKKKDIDSISGIEEDIKAIKADRQKYIDLQDANHKKIVLVGKAEAKKTRKEEAKRRAVELEEIKKSIDQIDNKLNHNDIKNINIDKLDSDNKELLVLRSKIDVKSNSFDNVNKLNDLESMFSNHPIDEEIIDSIKKDIADYDSLNQVVVANPPEVKKKKAPLSFIITLILSLVAIVVGLVITFAVHLIAGVITLVFGFILAIASVLIFVLKNTNNNSNVVNYVPINNEEKNKLETKLKEFFNPYKLYGMNFSNNLNELEMNYKTYHELKDKFIKDKADLEDLRKKLKEKENLLNQELNKFNLESYTIDEKLKELRTCIDKLVSIKENYDKSKVSYEKFIKDNALDEEDTPLDFDANQLQIEAKMLQAKIDQFTDDLREKQDVLDQLEDSHATIQDDIDDKKELESEIARLKQRDKILKATKTFLNETDIDVKAKYVEPMRESVARHLNELIDDKSIDFKIDTDFNFNGLEGSKQKEIKYYSKGYQQAISICLRLALIECIFKEEQPFLLLDDPFVDLDNNKLDNAKEMLKKISLNRQVVYLTCHDSRKI